MHPRPEADTVPAPTTVQRVSAVLWPAFLMAGVATVVFFAFLDPVRLFECTGEAPLSRLGAYSLAFLLFWLLCIGSSAGTAYFRRTDLTVAPPPGACAGSR